MHGTAIYFPDPLVLIGGILDRLFAQVINENSKLLTNGFQISDLILNGL